MNIFLSFWKTSAKTCDTIYEFTTWPISRRLGVLKLKELQRRNSKTISKHKFKELWVTRFKHLQRRAVICQDFFARTVSLAFTYVAISAPHLSLPFHELFSLLLHKQPPSFDLKHDRRVFFSSYSKASGSLSGVVRPMCSLFRESVFLFRCKLKARAREFSVAITHENLSCRADLNWVTRVRIFWVLFLWVWPKIEKSVGTQIDTDNLLILC